MNIIEHVWPMVSRQLVGRTFNGTDDLWHALQAAFRAIRPDQILKLYDSLPRRLAALVGARGGHTRY